MNFAKGATVFTCFKDGNDGEYHIGKADVLDVIQTYTPKGKPRKPKYRLRLENFKRGGKDEVEVPEGDIDFFAFAEEAVCHTLKELFRETDNPSAEERLLRAICGESVCQPKIGIGNLGEVIHDLISLQKALAEAFKIDAELAEDRIANEKGAEQ